MRSYRHILLAFAAVTVFASGASAAKPKPAPARAATAGTEVATFAGGCFWTMENDFEGVPGVKSVTSGYTGGTMKNPSYEDVNSGRTGHYESIEVVFDPAKVTYAQLVDRFWHAIDPTQTDGMVCDIGAEYRSMIFTHDARQLQLATESKARLEKSGILSAPVATKIVPATAFYPAEEYHQDFAKRNPAHYAAYREGCGRDRRTFQLFGKAQTLPMPH